MSSNILVTGAAGYIGGSVVAYFQQISSKYIQKNNVIAAVRAKEQAASLKDAGINAVKVDLNNEKAVLDAIQQNHVNFVVHCASGLETTPVINLVRALGERRKTSGEEVYFIHTSGGSAFSQESGWLHRETKDTDPVFQFEKELEDSNPLRKTDVTVTEHAKLHNVKSYVVVPTLVYGRGGGTGNQLSVCLPRYIKAAIAHKAVYKFEENLTMPAVHVSDLMAYYAKLVEKILGQENPPNGEDGTYFVLAHHFHWYKTLNRLAEVMHARGLVTTAEVDVWPSDDIAAEALGLPVPFMHMIWNSRTNLVAKKKDVLEWQPVWDNEDDFIETMTDEVQAVQDLDKGASSVFSALK